MANHYRMEILNTINENGLVPIFYSPSGKVVKQVVTACFSAGVKAFEFTNRGDFAIDVFKDLNRFCQKELPQVILGAGTISDEPTAAAYIAYGANFIVGPNFNEAVARICNRRKIPYIPGCGSLSEISRAEEFGAEIVKIFPGETLGGPDFVKAILGPSPWTSIIPTGLANINEESISEWFKAGVIAVGIGSKMIRKDLVKEGNYVAISNEIQKVMTWIRNARGEKIFLGFDHSGIYPSGKKSMAEVAAWYKEIFDFNVIDGVSSIFVRGTGPGRLELCKEGISDHCHLAIRVSNFESAMIALQAKGIELEEPGIREDSKTVFLKQPDPWGNQVHLLWHK